MARMSQPHSDDDPEAMVCPLRRHTFAWLGTGRAFLDANLRAIEQARASIRLEMYIFAKCAIGDRFRDALVDAAARGVQVRLLLDAIGSRLLPPDYFAALTGTACGEVKFFNKPSLETWSFRNHRKLLVVDDTEAFVGGCNIGEEYYGDGVNEGWRDGGISIEGPVMGCLIGEFEAQWQLAETEQRRQGASRRKRRRRVPCGAEVDALFVFPGLGENPLRDAIREDLRKARRVGITCPYFLPSIGLRRQIAWPERRGADVKILVAGKTDVALMRSASRSIYKGLLERGVEIYEYQAQILHAKVLVLDDIVYIGSSNLDPRSLRINFEIMLRIRDEGLADQAWRQFQQDLSHSRQITLDDVKGYRTWWRRLKQQFAYFILARLDPRVAEGNLRRWRRRQQQRHSQQHDSAEVAAA